MMATAMTTDLMMHPATLFTNKKPTISTRRQNT